MKETKEEENGGDGVKENAAQRQNTSRVKPDGSHIEAANGALSEKESSREMKALGSFLTALMIDATSNDGRSAIRPPLELNLHIADCSYTKLVLSTVSQ